MKLSLQKFSIGCLLVLACAFIASLMGGCETTGTGGATLPTPTNFNSGPLQVGDKIRLELSGTPSVFLPQEQSVKEDGTITILHVGPIKALGKTPRELEQAIHDAWVPDYYKQATVTITALNNRYFSVGGYVVRPDRYLYDGSTTLTRAIQAAGDFNEYANRKKIILTRPGSKPQKYDWNDLIKHPEKDPLIYPGDSIYVHRRNI